MTQNENRQLFQERLDALGAGCDSRTAERLAIYHALLEDWNQRVNLTADATLETMLDRHYIDSLAPLMVAGLFPQKTKIIDVGSGAGFPGLPLAIARPDFEVLLLDSLQKRLKFLDAVISELGLTNVRTAHARAEDAGHDSALRERFDMATARAVAAAPTLMELLLPLVKVGGKAVCYKGPSAGDELQAGNRAARMLGGAPLQTLPVEVPGQPDWQHCVLVSEKRLITPRTYPRKAGTPAKEPLGNTEPENHNRNDTAFSGHSRP